MSVKVYSPVLPSVEVFGAYDGIASATGVNQTVSLTFTPTEGTLFVVPYGDTVSQLQLEVGSTPSSYIPTSGSTVTRSADTLTVPSANLPWPEPNVIGEELFDGDTNNWSRGFFSVDGTLVYTGDTLTHTLGAGDTSGARWTLPIPCTVGNVLRLTVDDLTTSSSGSIGITPNANGTGYTASNSIAAGQTQVLVAATANPMYLTITATGVAGDTTAATSVSVREIDPLSVSIQMDGRMTYADEGDFRQVSFARWSQSTTNEIEVRLNTAGGFVGSMQFLQDAGTEITLLSEAYSPGINVPYNIASRHGSTFVNGAVDGTALTADTTPTALPDLSSTDLDLGFDYMGTIRTLRIWNVDLDDAGIEAAST